MMFLWIFLLVLLAIAGLYFGKKRNRALPWGNKKEDAFDILKKRFANGEIDDTEYEERKALLKNKY